MNIQNIPLGELEAILQRCLDQNGDVIVPRKPTSEMLEKGAVAFLQLGKGNESVTYDQLEAAWKAMLSEAEFPTNSEESEAK